MLLASTYEWPKNYFSFNEYLLYGNHLPRIYAGFGDTKTRQKSDRFPDLKKLTI